MNAKAYQVGIAVIFELALVVDWSFWAIARVCAKGIEGIYLLHKGFISDFCFGIHMWVFLRSGKLDVWV